MEQLVQLLQLLTTQNKIKVNINYLDSQGTITGSEQQVTSIATQAEQPLKSSIGQQQYNKLKYEIDKAQKQLDFNGIELTLSLQVPIADVLQQLNPPLVQPIANVTQYFDINLNQSIVSIEITNWYDQVYEIQYTYDDKWQTIYTTLDQYDLPVIPNKLMSIKIRGRKLNTVTDWSTYEVLTQKDILPPESPIVKSITPRYRATTIELEQPMEQDFDYFYAVFTLDSKTYTSISKTNTLEINIGKVYNNLPALIYQVDTSGNSSQPTNVLISSQQFTEAEQTIQNQIQNNTNIINQLTDQTTISIQITNITNNQVTVSDQTGIKSGYYLKLDKLYKITDVSGSTLILDRQPVGTYTTGIVQQPIQSFGTQLNQQQDAITANSQQLFTQQLESQLANGQYYYNGQIVDPNQDFLTRGIDVGFVVELIGTNKRITTTVKTIGVVPPFNQNILILNTTDPGPFNSYKVYSSQQFVQSKLAFDYDSITSTVESNNFNVVKAGTVTSINEIAGSVQVTGESFDQIKIGSVVKLSDQELTRYYTVTQVNGDTFYVEPKDYLQQYNESLSDKSYTIYDSKSIIQSQIAQTANEISTSIINNTSNIQSQIQQTNDQIALRVLKLDSDNPSITQLSVENGKIKIDQDQFNINADTLVRGTLRATESLEITGGENQDVRINHNGIIIKQGELNLGPNGAGGYVTKLENDGSGHLANEQIKWDKNGNVTFGNSVKIGFSNLDSNVNESINVINNQINNIQTQLNQMVVVLEQQGGQFMTWESDYTIIRQKVLVNGEEVNQSDSNSTPSTNQFTYNWYITDMQGNKSEILQFKNLPELQLFKDQVLVKQKIECEQQLR